MMSQSSSAPGNRVAALALVILGVALVIVSLFADSLGVSGGGEGFGFKQLIAVIVGLMLLFGGIGWLLRPMMNIEQDEPLE
jgi:membrane-bound ClpP family serine protease